MATKKFEIGSELAAVIMTVVVILGLVAYEYVQRH